LRIGVDGKPNMGHISPLFADFGRDDDIGYFVHLGHSGFDDLCIEVSSPNFLYHYFSFSLQSFQGRAVAYLVHDVV